MNSKKLIRRRERAWFWVPFAFTMSLLVFAAGIFAVDVQCRRMCLGDTGSPLTLSTALGDRTLLHYDILNLEGDLDITIVDNLVEYVEEKLQDVISSLSTQKPVEIGFMENFLQENE